MKHGIAPKNTVEIDLLKAYFWFSCKAYKNVYYWFVKPIRFATPNYISRPTIWETLLYNSISAIEKRIAVKKTSKG